MLSNRTKTEYFFLDEIIKNPHSEEELIIFITKLEFDCEFHTIPKKIYNDIKGNFLSDLTDQELQDDVYPLVNILFNRSDSPYILKQGIDRSNVNPLGYFTLKRKDGLKFNHDKKLELLFEIACHFINSIIDAQPFILKLLNTALNEYISQISKRNNNEDASIVNGVTNLFHQITDSPYSAHKKFFAAKALLKCTSIFDKGKNFLHSGEYYQHIRPMMFRDLTDIPYYIMYMDTGRLPGDKEKEIFTATLTDCNLGKLYSLYCIFFKKWLHRVTTPEAANKEEIIKNTRLINQGYRAKTIGFFNLLPKEVNIYIASLTGNEDIHSMEKSFLIAKTNFNKPVVKR